MKSQNIFVILSRPHTADNIGAAARAIKNMGFSKLRLVSPRRNWRRRAYVLARSARDVIDTAETYPTLSEAVSDLNWTFGTTRRTSERRGKFLSFETFVKTANQKSGRLNVGLVFGCESKGLNNEELDCCDQLVSLPSDPGYPSLNLSHAVMVSLFSLVQKKLSPKSGVQNWSGYTQAAIDKAAVQSTMHAFSQALECIGFYGGKDGRLDKIMKIMDALFKRAGMFEYEARMIKGLSARIIERASQTK